jgi:adenylosuccinate lyase
MRNIFDESSRIQRLLDVERVLAIAQSEANVIPKMDARKIASKAKLKYVPPVKINEIEKTSKHDVASIVKVLANACGSSGKFVHFGVTSSDIVDTAMATQLKDALRVIEYRLLALSKFLKSDAKFLVDFRTLNSENSIEVSQDPSFAYLWSNIIDRHIDRLNQSKRRIVVGKISGAVGTYASFGSEAEFVEKRVMRRLRLGCAEISTQIIQRDRYSEMVYLLAIIASSLESFSDRILDLWILKMPLSTYKEQKILLITVRECGKLRGLGKIVRSLVTPALENQITWGERDLTQSSAERFLIPQSCILVDYMAFQLNKVLKILVRESKLKRN